MALHKAGDCESEKCVVWCTLTVFHFSFQRDGVTFAALSQVWHASAECVGRTLPKLKDP
jgi:hypothetical protein